MGRLRSLLARMLVTSWAVCLAAVLVQPCLCGPCEALADDCDCPAAPCRLVAVTHDAKPAKSCVAVEFERPLVVAGGQPAWSAPGAGGGPAAVELRGGPDLPFAVSDVPLRV